MSQVLVEKTFGNRRILNASYKTMARRTKYACRFYMPEDGDLTKITFYVGGGNTGAVAKGWVYSDVDGAPGSLLGVTDEVPYTSAFDVWVTAAFASPISLQKGFYWIGFFYDSPDPALIGRRYYFTGLTNQEASNSDAYADGPSDPFGTPTYAARKMCIYASYTCYVTMVYPPSFEGNVVTQVPSSRAVRHQEKSIFAKGRHWSFYVDSVDTTYKAMYKTSIDKVSWTSPIELRDNLMEHTGENLQVIFDGTYFHIFVRAKPPTRIQYQRGLPDEDGTITPTADWVDAWETTLSNCDFYATLDSYGYPWIIWGYGTSPTYNYVYVTKSSRNDGIWATAPGYPQKISPGTEGYTNLRLPSLKEGKLYAMYFNAPGQVKGHLWDGSSWGSQEVCTTSEIEPQYAAANETWSHSDVVDESDNIHLIFLSKSDYDIIYVRRIFGVGWGSETIIQETAVKHASPVLRTTPKGLVAFWVGFPSPNIIFMNRQIAGEWAPTPTYLIDETTDTIPIVNDIGYDGLINSHPKTYDTKLELFWITGSSAPYNIKVGALTVPLQRGLFKTLFAGVIGKK